MKQVSIVCIALCLLVCTSQVPAKAQPTPTQPVSGDPALSEEMDYMLYDGDGMQLREPKRHKPSRGPWGPFKGDPRGPGPAFRRHKEGPDFARHPEMIKVYELERTCKQLAKKLRMTKDEKGRAKLEKELRASLGKLFPLRLVKLEREAERLEHRLEEVKSLLAKRKQNKKAIIDRRYKQLTGKMDHLEW